MLCLILIVGGMLIMMGQHDRSETLFYYFRLEDQVPEAHLLRLIEKHISFAFVRERLKQNYSETGRGELSKEATLFGSWLIRIGMQVPSSCLRGPQGSDLPPAFVHVRIRQHSAAPSSV
jgi:hypothetical protein